MFEELTQLYDMSLKREKKMQIFRTNIIKNSLSKKKKKKLKTTA